jgi:hypothetical protein
MDLFNLWRQDRKKNLSSLKYLHLNNYVATKANCFI